MYAALQLRFTWIKESVFCSAKPKDSICLTVFGFARQYYLAFRAIRYVTWFVFTFITFRVSSFMLRSVNFLKVLGIN